MTKNWSSDQEKLIKFEAEGGVFAKFLKSLKPNYFKKQCSSSSFLKFIYSDKATKFCEISTNFWLAVHRTNNWWRFRKIFVAFSEYMNFKMRFECCSLIFVGFFSTVAELLNNHIISNVYSIFFLKMQIWTLQFIFYFALGLSYFCRALNEEIKYFSSFGFCSIVYHNISTFKLWFLSYSIKFCCKSSIAILDLQQNFIE